MNQFLSFRDFGFLVELETSKTQKLKTYIHGL